MLHLFNNNYDVTNDMILFRYSFDTDYDTLFGFIVTVGFALEFEE